MKTRLCLSVLFLLMLVTPGDAKDPEVDVVTLQAENRMLKAQVASLKKKLKAGKIEVKVKVEPAAKPKTLPQKIEKILVEDDPSWWKDVSKFDLQAKLRLAMEDHDPKEDFDSWIKRNKGFLGKTVNWKVSHVSASSTTGGVYADVKKTEIENSLKYAHDKLSRLNDKRDDPEVKPTYAHVKAWWVREINLLEQDVLFLKRVMIENRGVVIKHAVWGQVGVRVIVIGEKGWTRKPSGEARVQGMILSVQRDIPNRTGPTRYRNYVSRPSTWVTVDIVGKVVSIPQKPEPKQIRRPKTVGH